MRALGIVAEYNPFHNGHLLQLCQGKAAVGRELSVVVMSGSFVQRGGPAIADKHTRTKMALAAGADMVLELPVCYATSSAEYFAEGAVKILDATGIVDFLCFGSESGDLCELEKIADILTAESHGYKARLKAALKDGVSYPAARELALRSETDNAAAPVKPNDILAVEYLKALKRINSSIVPYTIQRKSAAYHQTDVAGEIASATAVRNAVYSERWEDVRLAVPQSTFTLLEECVAQGEYATGLDAYSDAFQFALKSSGGLNEILDISEGLDNRFRSVAAERYAMSDIIDGVKTKRYTHTRCSRAALHILLGIKKTDLKEPEYIRILGVRRESANLIGELTRRAKLPVVTQLRRALAELPPAAAGALRQELTATDIYYLGFKNKKPRPNFFECGMDFVVWE